MGDPGTTERVLTLLGLLQQRRVWTGPELADRLGVTTRSIRRDIERLRALGYPVNAAQGAGGGYQLGAGRALPPLLLDDEEAIATAVSLRLAALGSVAGASEAAVRTLAKLDQVLPARLRAEVRALHDTTATIAGTDVGIDADVLMALARATRDRLRVEFAYEPLDGAPSLRRVEPYQLVANGRRWYLMGYDLDRDDWRTFRLDRLSAPRTTTFRFAVRDHPDPVEFVRRGVSAGAYPHVARVLLHVDAATARERVPTMVATIEPLPGREADRCVLVSGGASLDFIAMHIAVLGWEFEILDPPELRVRVGELAARLSAAAAR
jgi:predicted DNA-binding transcriptional regulator YafY